MFALVGSDVGCSIGVRASDFNSRLAFVLQLTEGIIWDYMILRQHVS